MGRLFGTDGVRGVAGTELTGKLAFQLGQAGAYVLTQQLSHKPKILVGKDTRISGDMLESALAAGICSIGAEAIMLGVVPTPAVAYLVRKYGADAGVVISASHNSYEYNGIKFFNSRGYKLNDETEEKIEAIILDGAGGPSELAAYKDMGRCRHETNGADDYISFAKSVIDCDLEGIKVAVDCSNGANSDVAKKALLLLKADVISINDTPDGININDGCGSTHIDKLEKYIAELDGRIGIAFDGDADRMLAVDETGKKLTGDEIMLIVGNYLKSQGLLEKDTIVATVMSNLGFFQAAERLGINAVQTSVGDRYVLEEMMKSGYSLGGEESGHIISLNHNSTGDGLISALLLLSIVKKTGKSLSELRKIVTILPQVLVNARVANENKSKLNTDPTITGEIKKLEDELKGNGRVLIRPSGTEPLVRVMLEGSDRDMLLDRATKLANIIEELIG